MDVSELTLTCFSKLAGELVKDVVELFLLVILTYTPVRLIKLVDQWLEDGVDDGVELRDDVLGDLTEQDFIVAEGILANDLARWCCSQEVNSLTSEHQFLSVRDREFLLMTLIDWRISRINDPVRNLVIDENS